MQAQLENPDQPTITSLVGGLIEDGQTLFKQQLELFKREVQDDVRRTGDVITSLVFVVAATVLAAGLLAVMLVHLLQWLTLWPIWTCYACVAAAFALIAGGFFARLWQQWQTYNPLPDKTAAALEENITWQTKPK